MDSDQIGTFASLASLFGGGAGGGGGGDAGAAAGAGAASGSLDYLGGLGSPGGSVLGGNGPYAGQAGNWANPSTTPTPQQGGGGADWMGVMNKALSMRGGAGGGGFSDTNGSGGVGSGGSGGYAGGKL